MGVNRQQALQGGFSSHQLVNVREEEEWQQYKGANRFAGSGDLTAQFKNNMAAHGIKKEEKLFCHDSSSTNTARKRTAHVEWTNPDTHETRRSEKRNTYTAAYTWEIWDKGLAS